jgi:nucleotide-binding universal stress UspA family protein
VSVSTDLLTGPTAVTLLNAIETGAFDLVVMNSHGRGGFARWLLGSVAEHLVHYATVPLLILRDSSQATATPAMASEDIWPAVVGLDGSALAEEALALTIQVLQALNAGGRRRLHLVRVERPLADADELERILGTPEQRQAAHALVLREAATALEAVAQRLTVQHPELQVTAAVIEHSDPAAALIDLAEHPSGWVTSQVGTTHVLIGIATHGRTSLARWTLGSVTYRVLEGSQVPVLVVRPRAIAQQQQAELERILASSPLRHTAPIKPPTPPTSHP